MTDWARHILTTNGVGSTVYNDEGNLLGHVVLSDYDTDGGYLDSDIEDLDGITVVLQSSTAETNETGIPKYHVWNLSVRSTEATALTLLELHGDCKQVATGWRRGRWTIRTTPKEFPKQGIYKPAPIVDSIHVSPTDEPQSLGHLHCLRAIFDMPDTPEGIEDMECIGAAYDVERYLTLTDHGKREARE